MDVQAGRNFELPLVVGVSTRAIFDLSEEDAVFRASGVAAYTAVQLERENIILRPGTAFEVIRRLLALNKSNESPVVKVVLISQNSPDLSLRAFNSFQHYRLPIKHGSFTSGRPVAPFVLAWGIDLFLSNDGTDVRAVASAGIAAARLGPPPQATDDKPEDEVRFAFDGDSVLFSEESDRRFQKEGLDSFLDHEEKNALIPMSSGPFGHQFFPKLAKLRQLYMRDDGTSRVRIAIVTARNAPAHKRVVSTLRSWNTPADEAHFVGRHAKAPILAAIRAHIFFDDQERHFDAAVPHVPSGLVPGSHSPNELVIPASL